MSIIIYTGFPGHGMIHFVLESDFEPIISAHIASAIFLQLSSIG